MSTYAIGDIQGCMEPLKQLLRLIDFQSQRDTLWLAGDLVNRGPASLDVLRWARDMGDRVVTVLGNHDLRLLCIAHGARTGRSTDTLDAVLHAPDRDDLLTWLQQQRVLHRQNELGMVHAGILPTWSSDIAQERAQAIEARLRGPNALAFLEGLCTEVPNREDQLRTPLEADVFACKVLTYMRVCHPDGELHLDFTGPPEAAPSPCVPWFAVPQRRNADVTWICGHWSALGLHTQHNIRALDTGCVWGGALTAYCLDDGSVHQVAAV